MNIKATLSYGGIFVIAAAIAVAITFYWQAESTSIEPDGIISSATLKEYFEQQLRKAEPNSPDAAVWQDRLRKLRDKTARQAARAENPEAFMAALAAIKTDAAGRGYPPNYKVLEKQRALQKRQGRDVVQGEPLPWVERGPGNVSGRARVVLVDPDDPSHGTWFVASVGGGVWKTTDAGANWRNLTPDLLTLSTMTMAMAASNHDVLYVGTGMGYGRVVDLEGSGVWKSTDRGESWQQLAATANGELLGGINRLVVDPEDENIVLVCSNNSFAHVNPQQGNRRSGIFRSSDGGASWTQVFDAQTQLPSNSDNRIQQIIATPGNFDVLYAAVNEVGVLKSTDAGLSWNISAGDFALPSGIGIPSSGGLGLAGISVRTELAIAPTDPNRVYAAVERPRGIADLYMSKDAGASWVLVNDTGSDPNWFNAGGQSGVNGAYTAGWFDNTIAVSPYDENDVIVGGVNIYRITIDPTSDSRSTVPIAWWIPNSSGIPVVHADHHWLTLIPVDESSQSYHILNANDGGVGYSTDAGASWTQITGMESTMFYGVDKKPGEDVYIGGTQDNGSWLSNQNPQANSPWLFKIGGDGFEALWNARDPNLVLGTVQGGVVHRSTDGGQSFQPSFGATAGQGPFITKLGHAKIDPDLVFTVGSAGIMRSDDFGGSWTYTAIQGNWLGYRAFDNVEVSLAKPQIVWITSRLDIDPPAGRPGGIHVSEDGGISFREVSGSLPSTIREASGLATHPIDANTAYLLFSAPQQSKILRTTNLGGSWEDLSGFESGGGVSDRGFPDVALYSLLVMPYNTDIMWAGTEIGLFVSNDGGASWEYSDNGLPRVGIFQMSIVDDQVVVATQGRGIWSVQLPELADYTLPDVTLSPRLHKIQQLPSGGVQIRVDHRSQYDSTNIMVNGNLFERVEGNESAMTTTRLFPVSFEQSMTVSVTAYKDGESFLAASRSLTVFPTTPRNGYSANFNNPVDTTDFRGFGLALAQPAGFNSPALHTPHPYTNLFNAVYLLEVPIIVADNNALLEFDEVVLVEEGSAAWPSISAFDFVLVEGSSDGCTWQPLINGYDSRADADWSTAIKANLDAGGNSTTVGTEALYKRRSIDLLQTFQPGDIIFIRFRMFADGAVVAWGWAIDNLDIQSDAVDVRDATVRTDDLRIRPAVPNPFREQTTIRFASDRPGELQAAVFDLRGTKVMTLLSGYRPAGEYSLAWDGRDDNGNKLGGGMYTVRVLLEGMSTYTTVYHLP